VPSCGDFGTRNANCAAISGCCERMLTPNRDLFDN
jgi:hypothetical protein